MVVKDLDCLRKESFVESNTFEIGGFKWYAKIASVSITEGDVPGALRSILGFATMARMRLSESPCCRAMMCQSVPMSIFLSTVERRKKSALLNVCCLN